MAIDKKTWVSVSCAVVAVACMALSIKSCNENDEVKDKIEKVKQAQSRLNARIDSAKVVNDSLVARLNDCGDAYEYMADIAAQYGDSINGLNDSIKVLRDSLEHANTLLGTRKKFQKKLRDIKKKSQGWSYTEYSAKDVKKAKPVVVENGPKAETRTPAAGTVTGNAHSGQTNVIIGNNSDNNNVDINNGTIVNNNYADTRPSYTRTITVEIERVRSR